MNVTAEESRRASVIGAGPAGLTDAFELLTRTNILPIVLEKSNYLGGIFPHCQLQRQSHRYRGPSVLFKIGARDAMVVEDPSYADRRG